MGKEGSLYSPKNRIIMILFIYEHITYNKIAGKLNMSVRVFPPWYELSIT